MFDGEKFGKMIVEEVRLYVSKSVGPLEEKIAALEQRIAQLEAKLARQ